jgi:hypothetical protein
MPTDWTDQASSAIANQEINTCRVLKPGQAHVIIGDMVEGKLAADELAAAWFASRISLTPTTL